MIRLSKLADYGIVMMTNMARHPERQHSAAVASSVGDMRKVPSPRKLVTRAAGSVGQRQSVRRTPPAPSAPSPPS